jgi:hypothetical protein
VSDALAGGPLDAFLQTFFGGDNRLKLERVQAADDERTQLVRPWVERLRHMPPLPTVLPRVRADRSVVWYALAFSPDQLRSLADDLLAFVGPTWSTFRGHRTPLVGTDPIDAAVAAFTGNTAFTFTSPGASGAAKAALEALERMRRVWALRPARDPEVPRATGRVLRDFHLALQSGDRRGAEAELEYLRSYNRLDALNLLFLRIQLLAGLGRWDELETLPELPSVLQVRRPPPVTEALIRAVYHGRLGGFEADDDPCGAVARFRGEILPVYGNLFISPTGMRTPEVTKSFMLAAVAAIPPRVAASEALLAREDLSDTDRAWLTRLAALVGPTSAPPASAPPADPLVAAAAATLELDFTRAFALAAHAPSSGARAKLLFECAYNLQTLEAERAALRALDELAQPEREAFLNARINAVYWEQLTAPSAGSNPPPEHAAPADWFAWLERLREDPSWSRAVAVAEQGALEWSVEAFLGRPNAANELLGATAALQSIPALHDALPHLLAFFQRDPAWPRESLRALYFGLLEFVVYSEKGGAGTLGRIRDLVEAVLRIGIGRAEYKALVQTCADVWDEHASPVHLDWALDAVDLFATYSCPDRDARVGLLAGVVGRLAKFHRRVEPEQWRFLGSLCDELGQLDLLERLAAREAPAGGSIGTDDPLAGLGRLSVAIYTLTEEAGRRAKDLLERRCAGVTVRLSTDHVGTDRLRDMARNADVFVMVTASAKHAATNFIEAHRPKDRPLLRPNGKGSASIIRSLADYARAAEVSGPG